MGLYESELSKQLHLRNRQKREWESMKKSMDLAKEKEKEEVARQKELFEQQKKDEDRIELQETETSKNLASRMSKSAHEKSDDTLQRCVEVLQNQNGK